MARTTRDAPRSDLPHPEASMADIYSREESGRADVIVAPSRIYVETTIWMGVVTAVGGYFVMRAHHRGGDLWVPGAITLAILAFLVYAGISWFAERIEIHKDRIAHRSLTGWRRMGMADIRGFQVQSTDRERYVVFLPYDPTAKRIRIFLQGSERVLEWARERFPEMDAKASMDERERIPVHEKEGAKTRAFPARLSGIAVVASLFDFLCALVFFWGMLLPYPREAFLWTAILCPIPALLMGLLTGGRVRAFSAGTREDPQVSGSVVMAALSLAVHAAWHSNQTDRLALLNPMAFAAVASILVCVASFPGARRRLAHWIGLVIFCTAYGCGAALALNTLLDKGSPQVHQVFVLEKHIRSGVVRTNEVLVGPGVFGRRPETFKVGRSAFDALRLREPAVVRVMPGRFGAPWCEVVPSPQPSSGR